MAKKYYWIKLQLNFFRTPAVKVLRRISGGDTYTVIYLEMLLLSLDNDGLIYFTGMGENMADEIALAIEEKREDVEVVLSFLKSKGLIKYSSENIFKFSDDLLDKLVGSETSSAKRVRAYRERQKALQCNDDVTARNDVKRLRNTDIDTDKDIDKDIDKNNLSEKSDKSKKPQSKSSKRIYDESSDYIKLSKFLEREIQTHEPQFRVKNIQRWADDFRKMVEIDKHDKHEISQIIKWCQHDDFWSANILSPSKLRKQYLQLSLKMKNQSNKKGNQPFRTKDQDYDETIEHLKKTGLPF